MLIFSLLAKCYIILLLISIQANTLTPITDGVNPTNERSQAWTRCGTNFWGWFTEILL